MAGTQQNNPRNSMFPPSLFDDPDTISQIAQAEIPQAPQQTPGDQANVPMTGVVPPTFLDWHADPANVAKVAAPIPKNTPMPSVVAAKVQSALQPTSDDVIPPLSPDIQGSPEAQLYGTPTPQAAPISDTTAPAQSSSPGPGLMNKVQPAASLDAALMNGAAPQTAASPAASAPPAVPLSRDAILASFPGGHAPIANAPYVPQGKKLALTGLFAALDNIGASLDHGTQTVGPGLMRQVEALREYNQNLPVAQRTADDAAIDQRLKQAQDVGGIQKTSIENQNLQLFGPPQQRKAQFMAQLQQEAEAGKIPPDELRRRALTTALYNGMNVAPEEIDNVIQNTKPIGPKFTVKTGEKGVFEGLIDRQQNFYPPDNIPNDPDAQALAKSATGIHNQLVNEEVDKESRVAGVAADRQGKQIAAAIDAANQGEANKTVNAGREQALKHLNDMRGAQNQLALVQDLASSKSPTDQTSLAFKALGLDLPDGVHRINEAELNAIKNQGSLPDRAYKAVLNWTTGQQFAPEILQDISDTATKIANSKIKNSNDNLRDVKRVYGYQVAGSGPNGGLDEAPVQDVRGSLSRSAAANSVPSTPSVPASTPAPSTHIFSVSAWKQANPKGDINAATALAKQQGYTVAP